MVVLSLDGSCFGYCCMILQECLTGLLPYDEDDSYQNFEQRLEHLEEQANQIEAVLPPKLDLAHDLQSVLGATATWLQFFCRTQDTVDGGYHEGYVTYGQTACHRYNKTVIIKSRRCRSRWTKILWLWYALICIDIPCIQHIIHSALVFHCSKHCLLRQLSLTKPVASLKGCSDPKRRRGSLCVAVKRRHETWWVRLCKERERERNIRAWNLCWPCGAWHY